jgi:hypothetical protein
MSHTGIKRAFEPGLYVLTEAVINPILDRRTRHDWRSITRVFAKGQQFILEHDDLLFVDVTKPRQAIEVRMKGARWTHHTVRLWLTEDEPCQKRLDENRSYRLGWALAPYLQRVGDFKPILGKDQKIATLQAALETIAAGNTDPDRMVELAQEALKEVQ